MSYDVKCGELAYHFLKDEAHRIPPEKLADTQAALAQAIQDEVERFLDTVAA